MNPPATSLGRGLASMLAAGLSFAGMALCVSALHLVEPEVHTLSVSAVRATVNLLVLVALVRGDVRGLVGDASRPLWLRGILGTAALLCYFAALQRLSAGEAAFLNQTSAAWVALLAPWLLKEPTRRWVWLAVGGSLVGMLLLATPRPGEADLLGRGLGLGSGLCAAGAYLSIRRASGRNPSTTIVFWFTWLAAAVAGVGALVLGVPWPSTPAGWSLAAATGVLATLGQLFMTHAYRVAPAAPVAAASASAPLLTAVLAGLLLGQRPDAWGMAGMGVLLASSVALPLVQVRRVVTPPAAPPGAQEAAVAGDGPPRP